MKSLNFPNALSMLDCHIPANAFWTYAATFPCAGVSAYLNDISRQRLNIISVRKALESKQKGSYQIE